MSFPYLWSVRERPSLFSRRWLKVWLKRIFNLPGLVAIIYRRAYYQAMGASLGQLTILGKLDLNGPASQLKVGERSFISSGVHLALHEKITIGHRVVINSGVQLLSGSHQTSDPAWSMFAKPIVIGDYAWVATSSIILPGVKIGEGAVVAAGAVVCRDVPEYEIVAGNPAKKVGQRCRDLSYSPVDLCASYEAWLGKVSSEIV